MNPLPSKNEWDAFDKAPQTTPSGETAQKPFELHLSGTHKQPLPYLNANNQMVQYAAKPVVNQEVISPAVNRKILAAKAGDPDPAASLADIRRLLVGPTRNLHDAMFEEVVTILEESDREVQRSLRSLEQKCSSLFHITEGLVFTSKEGKEQYRRQADLFQNELQKSAITHREMLAELFLVIGSKLEELTAEVNRKIGSISANVDASLREVIVNQEEKMRELEEKFLANRKLELEKLKNRLDVLERKSSSEKAHMSDDIAGGLSTFVDRLKALRDS